MSERVDLSNHPAVNRKYDAMAKVLIIDDDARITRLMTRALAGAGHHVIEAADGRKGVERFREHHPDLVITDLVMPGQEGIETILELRREATVTGIIAVSGGGLGQGLTYLDLASKLGADAVLPKPFRVTELVKVVDQVLLSVAHRSRQPVSCLTRDNSAPL